MLRYYGMCTHVSNTSKLYLFKEICYARMSACHTSEMCHTTKICHSAKHVTLKVRHTTIITHHAINIFHTAIICHAIKICYLLKIRYSIKITKMPVVAVPQRCCILIIRCSRGWGVGRGVWVNHWKTPKKQQ